MKESGCGEVIHSLSKIYVDLKMPDNSFIFGSLLTTLKRVEFFKTAGEVVKNDSCLKPNHPWLSLSKSLIHTVEDELGSTGGKNHSLFHSC